MDQSKDPLKFFSSFRFTSLFLMFRSLFSQEMLEKRESMRNDDPSSWSYQDRVFNSEINLAIRLTDGHYEAMMFREALKTGFYDLQVFVFFISLYTMQP